MILSAPHRAVQPLGPSSPLLLRRIWNFTALTLRRHSFRQIACQRASMADSSSRPLQALHTPTPLVPSSPRTLHKTLDCCFKSEGFTNAGFEESVWRRAADAKYAADIVISCHVDDSLIACSPLLVMRKFKSALLQRFTGTDEGPVTQYFSAASSSAIDPTRANSLYRTPPPHL